MFHAVLTNGCGSSRRTPRHRDDSEFPREINDSHRSETYFAYIFSFVMIGIHWVQHHYVFKLYERSDHNFALLNGLYLMCIAFVPFPTAVLARYVADPAVQKTAIVFYAVVCFFLRWPMC